MLKDLKTIKAKDELMQYYVVLCPLSGVYFSTLCISETSQCHLIISDAITVP